ncbi:MAG: tetratricopeptide repeat protein [Thermoplasmata archaeon]
MTAGVFANLVGDLVGALGQTLTAVRPAPEGIYLRTSDGFLYAFLEDPNRISLATIRRMIEEAPGGRHLVVFCRERLPLALTGELQQAGATSVEGSRFAELLRMLGLGTYIGEAPRARPEEKLRLLPSALFLEELMTRARTWQEWGVPALALRFYRQAAALKDGFLPARVGTAHALMALGLLPEAAAELAEVLTADPDSIEARLARAGLLGLEGHPDRELEEYRALLEVHPGDLTIRAHRVAALIDHKHWETARGELAIMLRAVPEDPRLRFLHAAALEHTGASREAASERLRARSLGLPPERERELARDLGLPEPVFPDPPKAAPATPPIARAARKPARTRRTPPRTGAAPSRRTATSRASGR